MNIENAFLNNPVNDPSVLKNESKVASTENRKKDLAKKFESIFINKLLDQMTNSVDAFNEEKDGASKQIHGIFNMYLSKHVSKNGGMGLWKNIYEFTSANNNEQNSVDESL